jgi:hypothetical protein
MDNFPDQGSMLTGLAGQKTAYKALGTPNPGFPSGQFPTDTNWFPPWCVNRRIFAHSGVNPEGCTDPEKFHARYCLP